MEEIKELRMTKCDVTSYATCLQWRTRVNCSLKTAQSQVIHGRPCIVLKEGIMVLVRVWEWWGGGRVEWIEELWVMCDLNIERGSYVISKNMFTWKILEKNLLKENNSLIPRRGLRMSMRKIHSCSRVLQLSEQPRCKESLFWRSA